jgi:hypothetical protein
LKEDETMKKLLIGLGLITVAAMPLAASAHTDLSIGIGIGGYYAPPPPRVYYYEPEVVEYRHGPPAYYYSPPRRVYGPRVVYRDYYYDRSPRYRHRHRHHGHDD